MDRGQSRCLLLGLDHQSAISLLLLLTHRSGDKVVSFFKQGCLGNLILKIGKITVFTGQFLEEMNHHRILLSTFRFGHQNATCCLSIKDV